MGEVEVITRLGNAVVDTGEYNNLSIDLLKHLNDEFKRLAEQFSKKVIAQENWYPSGSCFLEFPPDKDFIQFFKNNASRQSRVDNIDDDYVIFDHILSGYTIDNKRRYRFKHGHRHNGMLSQSLTFKKPLYRSINKAFEHHGFSPSIFTEID